LGPAIQEAGGGKCRKARLKVRAQRTTPVPDAYHPPELSDNEPVTNVIKYEQQAMVRSAISQLDEDDRTLVKLGMAGLTQAEIAKELGRPKSTVGKALGRIRRELAAILENSTDLAV
jgi:RNA polymerase sigma factor (sigma-70 family)